MNRKRVHLFFKIGVALKGIDGLLETAAGTALVFTSRASLTEFADWLTAGELQDDPGDPVASRVRRFLTRLAFNSKHFAAIYLLAHGVVKAGLAAALWRGKKKAYPAALAVLGFFLCYQLYRLALSRSRGLALVSAFDLAVLVLIWWDYRGRLPSGT
jgi:uncharacterized membrane protein